MFSVLDAFMLDVYDAFMRCAHSMRIPIVDFRVDLKIIKNK